MVKRLALLALFAIVFNFLENFAHKKTDGFSVGRVQFDEKVTFGNDKEILELNQSFHYLDCGNQCYAFVSDDGQYVLKLFKYASSPIPHFVTEIPLLNRLKPFKPHRFEKQRWKRQRDFTSYKLAWNFFRNETALIDTHLDAISHHYPTVTITDKLGCSHKLDLNQTPFVLQKKATPVYKQLCVWMAAGEIDQARKGIASLLILLKQRIHKGLQDDDVHFYSNFGFIGTQAIQLDPGHFTQGVCANPDLEMKTITAPLLQWCQKHAPSLILEAENE
jgi:hypothetical protein